MSSYQKCNRKSNMFSSKLKKEVCKKTQYDGRGNLLSSQPKEAGDQWET